MKRYFAFAIACLLVFASVAPMLAQPGLPSGTPSPASSIERFLPVKGAQYNPAILSPQEFLGFELDERLADWGDITRYVDYLEKVSDRVSVERYGYTFERRRFLQVCITSPANQRRLEQIREEHLRVTDATQSAGLNLDQMPLVVDLSATIHGNEISGSQGLIAVLFYYAAVEDKAVEAMLDNTVLLVVPAQNPDGMSRFAMWVNSNASLNHFVDNQAREYREVTPSSRSNHYWMDCNRDWLTAQYPEGRNLVTMYEHWMPNVLLDLHEMGSSRDGLYYYSPGDPNRTYQYIPQENQDLTRKIEATVGQYLDTLGVPHFSGRGYDDFFIGKGGCYGDIQGSVCMLHELSSTRGHVRDYGEFGVHSFGETVCWQASAAIGVVDGAVAHAAAIKDYQRRFFQDARRASEADPSAGYVLSARGNRGIAFNFLQNLLLHEIEVYPVVGEETKFFVPFRQRHYYKIKGIFEDITTFQDDRFYDVSTWSPARGYNLEYGTVTAAPALGEKITTATLPAGKMSGVSSLGYRFASAEFYAPYLITALQKQGIKVEAAGDGTLVVPVEGQPCDGDALYACLSGLAAECAVEVTAVPDKRRDRKAFLEQVRTPVRQPRTAIITDIGSSTQQGAFWHMLDAHFGMNHSLVNYSTLMGRGFDADRYDVMVFMGRGMGPDTASAEAWEKISKWVEAGGTLILVGEAHVFADKVGGDCIKSEGGRGVSGLVLSAEMAQQSPLFWGYNQPAIDVYKNGANVWTVAPEAEVLMRYAAEPYRSGYVTPEQLAKIAGTPLVALQRKANGRILYIQEDFAYRAYWLGTNHILSNALLFGDML